MDRRKAIVCYECLAAIRRPKRIRIASSIAQSSTLGTAVASAHRQRLQTARLYRPKTVRQFASEVPSRRSAPTAIPRLDLNAIYQRVQELSGSVLKHEKGKLPSEQRVLYVLEQFESITKALVEERGRQGALKSTANAPAGQETATSALLGSVNARQYPAFISKANVLSLIGQKAEEIARNPHVFISPAILKAYVDLQALLQQPTSFPDVFSLYASKSLPALKGNQVVFTQPSPDKINAAIDAKTANEALTAAIRAHNLPVAIDIITTSFSTPAFKKAKILRQAAFPVSGLAIAPFAAYTLSGAFSSLQQTMDPSTATGIAFAGIMTYVGAVSMVGYVAVTTANDQMDRVTWANGVPLWERWIREEERAAVDRVAGAWGFTNVEKRGEEEGDDWESLREWAGVRGMVLDRVSLMEGME